MSYVTGGLIEAVDYNTFATLAASMNEVFADLHPGATTIGAGADYGYGQTPALTPVSVGASVLATEWAALFDTIRNCGTHQGTTVVPPLPVSNPAIGNNIVAENTPTTLASLISTIRANRQNLAVGQSTLTAGTSYAQTAGTIPWTNSLTWNCQADFSSWNNARYFFNAGGFLGFNGSMSPLSTPEDTQWQAMLTALSPMKFTWNATTPNTGSGGTAIGFYGLTTSYQTIYLKAYGSGAYSASTLEVKAKLNAAAGTNGLIDFQIIMTDNEAGIKSPKNGTTTFRVDNTKATGAVTYPGPAVSVVSVGANNGFIAT